MKIVFDANVIVEHWHLKGPSYELLKKFLNSSDSQLVIPQIVILEVLNQYREKLSDNFSRLKEMVNKTNGFLSPEAKLDTPNLDLIKEYSDYEYFLDQRLNELSTEKPDHSDIPHEVLLNRDLSRRKPFQKSGKGYRDAILWEVILNKVVDASYTTVLITADKKDFWHDKKRELHPDLKEDLTSRGLDDNCVLLLEKIEDFNDQYVKVQLATIENIKSKLQSDDYPLSVSEWIQENIDRIKDQLLPHVVSVIFNIVSGEATDPFTIEDIEIPSEFKILNVLELADSTLKCNK